MEFLQEITLELNSNTAYTTVGAKQGDHQSRNIKIHFTANGEEWQIPSPQDVEISYRVRKPDGHAVWNPATVPEPNPENVIYITLTEQTLAVPGRAYADILFKTGSGEGKQVLSSVSFIIIIMASPNIADNVISSDEFAKVLDIADNANITIHESEAWAIGKRDGIPVIGNDFSYRVEGGTFTCNIDEDIFCSAQNIGQSPGYTRTFIFNCQDIEEGTGNLKWTLEYPDGHREYNVSLEDYGITITGSPLQSNSIYVTVTNADKQYHNNSLYWSNAAKTAQVSIDNLTISAETILPEEEAYVEKDKIDDVTLISKPNDIQVSINKATFAHRVGQVAQDYTFIYNGTKWTLDQLEINDLGYYGIGIIATRPLATNDTIVINYNSHQDFTFYIPKGDTGDVNFMTFDIHLDDGELWMTRPNSVNPDISFGIDNNTGNLFFEIEN